MNKEKRVAFLDYSPHYAGAERAMSSLIMGLKEKGYIPCIVVPYPSIHHERYRELGVEVFHLNNSCKWWMGRSRWVLPVRGADFVARCIWGIQLAVFLLRKRIRLLHVNLLRPDSLMWILFSRLTGAKIVAHFRSLPDSWIPRKLVQKCCHHVICVSKIVQTNLKKFFADANSSVIYDPVSVPSCLLSREEAKNVLQIHHDRTVLASVAALFPNKGHEQAIRSFALVLDKYPNVDLHIVGGGNQKELARLKAIVRLYPQAENRIFFTESQVSNVEVVYKAASLVLSLTQEGEAFGLVPLEASLMGTPSIAPVRGAIVEFTEHNYSSFLVETRDVDEIARMIDFVLSNPDVAVEVSNRMKNKVEIDFSVSRHAQMVVDVYNSLM